MYNDDERLSRFTQTEKLSKVPRWLPYGIGAISALGLVALSLWGVAAVMIASNTPKARR